jgi:hypothetical protein
MRVIIILTLSFFIYHNAFAQGCADAGFCTADNIKPNPTSDTSNTYRAQLKIGHSYGLAQFGVHVFSPYIEYRLSVSQKLNVTAKLLGAFKVGELATVANFSDVIVTGNYKINPRFSVIGGFKAPFNAGNLSQNGKVLPMSYQSSLGTFDFIGGAVWQGNKITITAAVQQPLTQNKNTFLNATNSFNKPYYSTNNYVRRADVLLRLSYPMVSRNQKSTFTPSVMPIYHLGNDLYTNSLGKEVEILESTGLTLNLGGFWYHRLNERNALELSLGFPVVSRNSRPDGLSQFAFTVDYIVMLQPKKKA